MSKFKVGDIVYYNSDRGFLPYNKPYEIDGVNDDSTIHLKGEHASYGDQAFISEEKYKGNPTIKSRSKKQKTNNKFKVGDIVYYNGKKSISKDVPYRVVDLKDGFVIVTKSVNKNSTMTTPLLPENLISEQEYNYSRGIKKNIQKFKAGDLVYYNGPSDESRDKYNEYCERTLNKNVPYEVKSLSDGIYGITLKNKIDTSGPGLKFLPGDFISKEEYEKNNPSDEEVHKSLDAMLNRLEQLGKKELGKKFKKDFEVGDIVYYNGNGDYLQKDKPYKVKVGNQKDIGNLITLEMGNDRSISLSSSFVISEEEYNNKRGIPSNPVSHGSTRTTGSVGSYKEFKEDYKVGDIVYYNGDKIKMLNKKTPYEVNFFNRLTRTIQIKGFNSIFPSDDFIPERIAVVDTDTTTPVKGDSEMRLQIFRDTKDGKLLWSRPYDTMENHFRCYIYLTNPPKAYLRMELKKPLDVWELVIFYHRTKNPITGVGGDTPILVRKIKESNVLVALSKKIEMQISERGNAAVAAVLGDASDKDKEYPLTYEKNEINDQD